MDRRLTFYLAAKYDKRVAVSLIAATLRQYGHTVRAEWLEGSHEGRSEAEKWSYARTDIADIQACTHFVMFQLPVENPELSSGRHVELGYALALSKHCIVVGQGDSVFYTLAIVYKTVQDFLDAFAREADATT